MLAKQWRLIIDRKMGGIYCNKIKKKYLLTVTYQNILFIALEIEYKFPQPSVTLKAFRLNNFKSSGNGSSSSNRATHEEFLKLAEAFNILFYALTRVLQ